MSNKKEADAAPAAISDHTTAITGGKIFYGWVIAFASSLGIAFSVSVFLPTTTGLLVRLLHRDFGWTAPQIYLALTFATISTILAAPFVGHFIDRYGARRVIGVSFLIEALLMASLRYMDHDIRWFYARYAAFALFCTGTTAIGFSALISRWFNKRRGLALGIALGGLGAGGVFWSLLTQFLFDRFGWRDTFVYLGAIIALVVLPILMATLRNSPQSMGLEMDGEPSGGLTRTEEVGGVMLREATRDGQYWLMLVTFFLIACATYGVMLNLVPLLQEQGASAQYAAAAQASIWSVLVLGRLVTGWLMDRYFAPHVALGFLIPPIVGIAMLAVGVNGPSAFAAAMLVGLAAGAEVDVMAYLASRYFGLRHFGAIYATLFSIYAVGTSAGPVFTAWLVARNGEYGSAMWCLVGALCVASALLFRFRPFNRPSSH
jgi:MFS family permease